MSLLTTAIAAQYLGVGNPQTLETWRRKGIGPAYKKIGRQVRYAVADLDAYIATQANQQQHTDYASWSAAVRDIGAYTMAKDGVTAAVMNSKCVGVWTASSKDGWTARGG